MKKLIFINLEREENLRKNMMGDLNDHTSQVEQQCNMFYIHIFEENSQYTILNVVMQT